MEDLMENYAIHDAHILQFHLYSPTYCIEDIGKLKLLKQHVKEQISQLNYRPGIAIPLCTKPDLCYS